MMGRDAIGGVIVTKKVSEAHYGQDIEGTISVRRQRVRNLL